MDTFAQLSIQRETIVLFDHNKYEDNETKDKISELTTTTRIHGINQDKHIDNKPNSTKEIYFDNKPIDYDIVTTIKK